MRSFQLGLAHRLLAVQDATPRGRQPMALPGGRFWITYNGEIYNFPELRTELRAIGVTFRTTTDTEVLLALWAQYGVQSLSRLRGMFAFALFDSWENTLWVARDRFGIKPVYYAPLPEDAGVVIASEFRAIHASELVEPLWLQDAVRAFLAAGVNKPDEHQTYFEGIREVPPGCFLRIRPGEIVIHGYYSLPPVGECSITEADLPEVRARFQETIQLHLRSTKEVGVCLSGGLDSSNIVCAVAQILGSAAQTLQTFSVGREDSTDSALAALTSEHLGIRQHQLRSPQEVSLRDLAEMVVACETPNHTWGPINQFHLLKHIRRDHGISVLLNGHGGDEVLSGYPWFVPAVERFVRERNGAMDADALRTTYAAREPLAPRPLRMAQRMYASRRVWLQVFEGGAAAALGVSLDEIESWGAVQYFLNDDLDWADMRHQQLRRRELPHHLRHEDRLAMWFSIESRAPFLDHGLVDLFGRMDPRFLYRDGYAKYPLRVLFPTLPEAVRWETRKSGYWEHHSEMPELGALARRAVEESKVLMAMIPDARMLNGLTPLTAWRFLQMAILTSQLGASEAGVWLEELTSHSAHAAIEVAI